MTPVGSSEDVAAPSAKTGAGRSLPDHVGSRSEPLCTVSVTGAGGATVFGQSAPATDSRSR